MSTECLMLMSDDSIAPSDSSTRFIPLWKDKARDYQACPTSRWGVPQENSVTAPGRLWFLTQIFPLANSFLWGASAGATGVSPPVFRLDASSISS